MKYLNKPISLYVAIVVFLCPFYQLAAMTSEEWVRVIKAASESSHHSILELKGRIDAFNLHSKELTPQIVGALIDENKKTFDSILKKTSPHYHPSQDSTYAKDIAYDLLNFSIGVATFGKSTGNDLGLGKSRTYQRALNDSIDWYIDNAIHNIPAEKQLAREELAFAVRTDQSILQVLSNLDYKLFHREDLPLYKLALQTNSPELKGLTPDSSFEDAENKFPLLRLKSIKEDVQTGTKNSETILKNLINISSDLKNDLKRSLKERQEKVDSEKDSLQFEQKINAFNSSIEILSQSALLTKNKDLQKAANGFNAISHFVVNLKKIEQRDFDIQRISEIQKLEKIGKSFDAQKFNPNISNLAKFEVTTLYLSMGLSLVSMFMPAGEDPVIEGLKQIMSQIQDLGEMIQERFDIVDTKLNQIILEFKELKELDIQNAISIRAHLVRTMNTLNTIESELYSQNYQLIKSTRNLIDEDVRASVSVLLRDMKDSKKFESALIKLSQWAYEFSKESQRSFLPLKRTSTHEKIQELKTRDISELGALIASELDPRISTSPEIINNLTLNTKSWSQATDLIAKLIDKKRKEENTYTFDTLTLEDLEKVKEAATLYSQSLAHIVNENPKTLSVQLEVYKESLSKLIEIYSQNYTYRFFDKKNTSLQVDGSFEDLLKRAENLPQPEWGRIHSSSTLEEKLFGQDMLFPGGYESYTKVPDSVWKMLSPELKLVSWLPQKLLRVTCMQEIFFTPTNSSIDYLSYLKNKKIFDYLGNLLDGEKTVKWLQSTIIPLGDLPRIHWLFLTSENGQEKVVSDFWADFLVFGNEPNFRDEEKILLKKREFIKKYALEIADYNHSKDDEKRFHYLKNRYPFIKSEEFYLEKTPEISSSTDVNFQNYIKQIQIRPLLMTHNHRLMVESPNWILNERLAALTATAKEWFSATKRKSQDLAFTISNGQRNTSDNLKEDINLRALLIQRGSELLYPNLDPETERYKLAVFQGPARLLNGEDVLTLIEQGISIDEIKNITSSKIEETEKFLDFLSKKNYLAPVELVHGLLKLEKIK